MDKNEKRQVILDQLLRSNEFQQDDEVPPEAIKEALQISPDLDLEKNQVYD